MRTVRLACLVAATLWVQLHTVLAFLYLEEVASIPRYAIALLVFQSASLLAVLPLVSAHPAVSRSSTLIGLAACVPLVQYLNATALGSGAITGYGNWAAGGLSVILASLAFRGHFGLAIGAATGLIAAQTSVYFLAPGPEGFSIPRAVLLAVPPQVWILGAWAIRRILLRGDALVSAFSERASWDAVEAESDGWQATHRDRLAELNAEVIPFLRKVAGSQVDDPADAETAAELASKLRDNLGARAMLDEDVRVSLGAARKRGVRVSLSSEEIDADTTAPIRRVLVALLGLPALRALTARVTRDAYATFVLTGELHLDTVRHLIAVEVAPGPFEVVDLDSACFVTIPLTKRDS